MLFEIERVTAYAYSEAVTLGVHILRLRPRGDGAQRVVSFTYVIEPQPSVVSESLDLEGNVVTHAWFSGRTNPFDDVRGSTLSARLGRGLCHRGRVARL